MKSKKWALCVLVFMLLVFAGCTRATEEGMELFEQKKYDEALELFQKEAESGEEQPISRKSQTARNCFLQ